MLENPYRDLPDTAFWRRGVSELLASEVDPVFGSAYRIGKSDAIVSAGSCFAANITRHLVAAGYNYLFTERLHPVLATFGIGAEEMGYGQYSAAYGNIYTPRQMCQLIDRAFDVFAPADDRWIEDDGSFVDPFRPMIRFRAASAKEFEALRNQHFRAVRTAFESCDVFIFTLGLTEAWASTFDGAVYPVCPGTVAGKFDRDRYTFLNFNVTEVTNDIKLMVEKLRACREGVRVILTVSPVPLVATATANHVLSATIWSKSVLRVAAQSAVESLKDVYYFPSYEIITGPQALGGYFQQDRRSVSADGIAHVMRVFFKHFADGPSQQAPIATRDERSSPSLHLSGAAAIVEAECEEELVDVTTRRGSACPKSGFRNCRPHWPDAGER
jgi:hypothetical protein